MLFSRLDECLNSYVKDIQNKTNKTVSRSTLNEASFLDRFHKPNNTLQNQLIAELSKLLTQAEENNRSNQVVYEVNFYSRLPEDILIEYMKLGTPDNQRNNGVFLSDNGTDKVPLAFKDQHSPMKGCHAYTLYATNYRLNGAFAEPNKQVLQTAILCINSTLKKALSTVSQGKVNTSIVLADPVKESTRKGGLSGLITITTKPLEGIDYTGNKENITLITGAARDKIQLDDEKFTAEWRAENAKKNAHNEASDEGPSWATLSTLNAAASRGQSTTGYRANSASDRSPYYATSSTQLKLAQQGVLPTLHKDYGTNPGLWRGSKANESLNEEYVVNSFYLPIEDKPEITFSIDDDYGVIYCNFGPSKGEVVADMNPEGIKKVADWLYNAEQGTLTDFFADITTAQAIFEELDHYITNYGRIDDSKIAAIVGKYINIDESLNEAVKPGKYDLGLDLYKDDNDDYHLVVSLNSSGKELIHDYFNHEQILDNDILVNFFNEVEDLLKKEFGYSISGEVIGMSIDEISSAIESGTLEDGDDYSIESFEVEDRGVEESLNESEEEDDIVDTYHDASRTFNIIRTGNYVKPFAIECNGKILGEFIASAEAYEYLQDNYMLLDESLNEGLSEEEKVKLWSEGRRNVNIKACSDDKLYRYYKIADELGYRDLRDFIIGDELYRRGLSIPKSTSTVKTTTATPTKSTTTQASAPATPTSTLEILKDMANSKYPRVVTNGMTAAEIELYQDELFNELVPSSGAADTEAGEILSAWNYGLHRYFNDGDWFYGFGDTWNKSALQCTQYLRDYVGPGLGRAAMYAKSANEFVLLGSKLILNKIFKELLYDVPCQEDWRSYRYK